MNARPGMNSVSAPRLPAALRAFSLVEVMIATGILGILIFALLSGISFGFTNMRLSRENERATQILLEKLEQFRLFNWQQVTTNGLPTNFIASYYPFGTNSSDNGFNYTGTVTIASSGFPESYGNSLVLVTVQVNWLSGNMVRQKSAMTLVGSNGLFNYNF